MKKIISTLFALLLLAGLMPMSAFATEDEPVEYVPSSNFLIYTLDDRDYIISQSCEVRTCALGKGTLTIASGATVTVTETFFNRMGTINIYGDLNIKASTGPSNNFLNGTVNVYGNLYASQACDTWGADINVICNGKISGFVPDESNVTYVGHQYENGVCIVCGQLCENEFHDGIHTCPDCGMVVNTMATGSILSQGYPEIVFGVGGLAVGFLGAMFIFRKKKVAVSSASAEDEE